MIPISSVEPLPATVEEKATGQTCLRPVAHRDGVGSFPGSVTVSPLRLLVIDDDPAMLRATARVLRSLGWDVTTSETPIACEGYSCVLSDWSPWGNRVCWQAKVAGVPVVVFTADPGNVNLPVPVVAKPYDAAVLDAELRKAVRP